MGLCNTFDGDTALRKTGGGGGTTIINVPASLMPDDWVDLPAVNIGDQKVVLRVAVHDVDQNPVALQFAGNVTVDWGDGSATQDYSSGSVFEYDLDYADFAGTECSEGYRQAIVTITPQSGQTLTQVYLDRTSPTLGASKYPPILEVVLAGASISLLSVRSFSSLKRLRRFELVGPWSISSLSYTFFLLDELVEVEWPATTSFVSISNAWHNCYALRRVAPFDTSALTASDAAIKGTKVLGEFPDITSSVLANRAGMAQSAAGLNKQINMSNFTGNVSLLYSSTRFPVIKDMDLSACDNISSFLLTATEVVEVDNVTLPTAPSTAVTSFITSPTNLKKFNVTNLHFSLNLTNSAMSAAALNQVFTNALAGSYTITVTGSPGAATCDPSIATVKGITVVTS